MLIWHGEQVKRNIMRKARKDVLESALVVENLIKKSMHRGGRTESGAAVVKAGTKRTMIDPKSGERAGKISSFRSRPGEVPRVQTGRLRRGITHWLHPTLPISRVGTNVKYGKTLEFGTSRMKARPFMWPALIAAQKIVESIFRRPMGKI